MRVSCTIRFGIVLACLCVIPASQVRAEPYPTSYAVLAGAGGGDINNRGQVLGVENGRLFLWSDGAGKSFLDNPADYHFGGPFSTRPTLNDHGVVAGTFIRNDSFDFKAFQAFRWDTSDGRLDILPGTSPADATLATGINDAGNVVGFAPGQLADQALLWPAGGTALVPVFAGKAVGIDAAGRIAGRADVTGPVVRQTDGSFQLLSGAATPVGVNAAGDVLGEAAAAAAYTLVLWPRGAGSAQTLLTSSQFTSPVEVNTRRDVAFNRQDGPGGTSRGVLSLANSGNRQFAALDDLVSKSVRDSGVRFTSVGGINDSGQVSASMLLRGETVGARLTPFHKFKQYEQSAQGNWGIMPLRPSVDTGPRFSSVGCLVTALATVESLYGIETDPLQTRDRIEDHNQWLNPQSVDVNVASFWTRTPSGSVLSTRRVAAPASLGVTPEFWSLPTVVGQLQSGKPVLLRLPSFRPTLGHPAPGSHFVVAFGIRPTLAPGQTVQPSDILISDPGHGPGTYDLVDDRGAGEDLTLQRYFDKLNARQPGVGYSPSAWFDQGVWGNDVSVGNDYRRTMVTEFVTGAPAVPSIVVQSPVQLVLTDRLTGAKYATEDVPVFGATLLTRMATDWVSDVADESDPVSPPGAVSTSPDPPFDEQHPPYTLVLPPELVGHSLDVTIVGVDFGEYMITYHSGTDVYESSAPLQGTSLGYGDVQSGAFIVTPVPDPAAGGLCAIALGSLAMGRRKRRRRVAVPAH
jgi:hypothetical protein